MTVVINGTTGIDTGTGSLVAADSTTATYLDMFEDTDNGSNFVRLIAPTSIAANRTITLPDQTGTLITSGGSGVVTQAMLATAVLPLGVGQTWQSMGRSGGVTYTNTTGRAIYVAVTGGLTGSTMTLFVDSNAVSQYGNTAAGNTTVGAVVPNGSTYGTSGPSPSLWWELR